MPNPEALTDAVAAYVRKGYRVESQTPTQAVVVYGKKVNHILHLILSVLTLGLWLIVWLLVGIGAASQETGGSSAWMPTGPWST